MASDTADELARVRELRQRGLSPKEIARAVGLPPARVGQMVRQIGAAETVDPARGAVVECWVSPGWSAGLTVTGHSEWREEGVADDAVAGLIGVLVAREAGRGRVSACGWLVDGYCLGVKNDVGPREMYLSSLPRFVHDFFAPFKRRPVPAPLELAQHLVLGAVEYARGLGFEPAAESDFADTHGHLGPWEGPSAIGFGRRGRPVFIAGPHDNAARVIRQLERSVGAGNFDYVVGVPG